MSERPPSDVMSALPRTRPHRRSQKRKPAPASNADGSPTKAKAKAKANAEAKPQATSRAKPATKTTRSRPAKPRAASQPRRPSRLQQPAQPEGTPPNPRSRRPLPATGTEIVGTAVQAAAELAEIGLSMSARVVRNAVARLPRP